MRFVDIKRNFQAVLGMSLLTTFFWISQSMAERKECLCKCVVKTESGNYVVVEASGVDRVAAGESLKKKMAPGTCELSPECSGSCSPVD